MRGSIGGFRCPLLRWERNLDVKAQKEAVVGGAVVPGDFRVGTEARPQIDHWDVTTGSLGFLA